MKSYIDTNILLDLIFQRENSHFTRNFIQDNLQKDILVVNNVTLNNFFYLGTEKFKSYDKTFEILKFIENSSKWEIYDIVKKDRLFCYEFMDKNQNADFEDLQQYISAKNSNCDVIITNDKNFPKLDIPLIRTNPNLENYTPENKSETNETKEEKGVIDKLIDFVRKNR